VRGAGGEIQNIYRTGSQADIQQERDLRARDLIRQADLENYREQVKPTIKTIIAEIDDIEPNFRKVRCA
jgi:hypothetical protein